MDTGDRIEVKRSLFGSLQRLRVTLYPKVDVEWSQLRTELIFAKGAPRIVAALHPRLPDRASPDSLHDELRRMTRGAETVAPYVALESAIDADGAIVVPPLTDGDLPARRRRHPTRVRLVLHNAEGGFILVDPLPGIPDYNGYRETRRRMRKAPADGYRPMITIDFKRAHLDGQHFFFYCRFGDRYCEGELTALEVHPSDPGRLRGHLQIWFNDAGGRELPEGH